MSGGPAHHTGNAGRIATGVLGFVLIVLGAGSAVISWGPLGNLFADYQDSPASTYLLFGLPLLIGGLIAIITGTWLLTRSGRRDRGSGV